MLPPFVIACFLAGWNWHAHFYPPIETPNDEWLRFSRDVPGHSLVEIKPSNPHEFSKGDKVRLLNEDPISKLRDKDFVVFDTKGESVWLLVDASLRGLVIEWNQDNTRMLITERN